MSTSGAIIDSISMIIWMWDAELFIFSYNLSKALDCDGHSNLLHEMQLLGSYLSYLSSHEQYVSCNNKILYSQIIAL